MDATKVLFPANRQSPRPGYNGGAEEPLVPMLHAAPTFGYFTTQMRLYLIATGKGGPGSVGDGKII